MDKIVYFLGAGASAASEFRLPTMEKFFESFNVKDYPNLTRFIIKYFFSSIYPPLAQKDLSDLKEERNNELNEMLSRASLNIEEVLNYLEFHLNKPGKFGRIAPAYLYDAKREIYSYIIKKTNVYLEEIKKLNENKVWSDKFKSIFSKLSPRDSIITLNYDPIVEATLENIWTGLPRHPLLEKLRRSILGSNVDRETMELGGYPFYKIEEAMTGVFLKLHGSINWVYCPEKSCPNHLIFPMDIPQMPAQMTDFPECNLCGEHLEIAIVPPTMYKIYEDFPILNFIWSIAHKELLAASTIVIIGLSFAPSDSLLRWLFKSAIAPRQNKQKPKIEVINKTEEKEKICSIVKKITGIEPEFKGNFDEYIKKIETK